MKVKVYFLHYLRSTERSLTSLKSLIILACHREFGLPVVSCWINLYADDTWVTAERMWFALISQHSQKVCRSPINFLPCLLLFGVMSFVALIAWSASKATKAKRTHHVTNWNWQTEIFCFATFLLCSGNTNRLSKTAEYEIYLPCLPRNSTWYYFPCYRLTVVTDGWINFCTIKRAPPAVSTKQKSQANDFFPLRRL